MEFAHELAGWPLKDLAGWTASAATIGGAVLTAANLGSRITGWGFVSFTLGSIAWALLGLLTQEQSLLITNVFLALVNALGIWRWLGHKARYEKAADELARQSLRPDRETLLPISTLPGAEITDRNGVKAGTVVEVMLNCRDGTLAQVVVGASSGPIAGEELRKVDGGMIRFTATGPALRIDRTAFLNLPVLEKGNWAETAPRADRPDIDPPPAG